MSVFYISTGFVIQDETQFITLAKDFFINRKFPDESNWSIDSVDDIMRIMFTDRVEKLSDGVYESTFDMRFLYENLIDDFFKAVSPALSNHDHLYVSPDYDHYVLIKNDEEIIYIEL